MTDAPQTEVLIRGHLSKLAVEIGPRPVGTAANNQAFAYIKGIASLPGASTIGLDTVDSPVMQRLPAGWPARQLRWTTEHTSVTARIETEARPVTLRNIIVDFGPGASKPCFVAHYDSKPMSPGANDNASGVAVLLAMLESWPKDRPARFIFFDGEELGCKGSHAYVDELEQKGLLSEIGSVVCPDSVGLGELYLYTADKHGAFPEAALKPARQAFAAAGWAIPERAARSGGSDFWPFHIRGIPCLFLSDFPNHVRHTTVDTIDAVDVPVLARLAKVLTSIDLA